MKVGSFFAPAAYYRRRRPDPVIQNATSVAAAGAVAATIFAVLPLLTTVVDAKLVVSPAAADWVRTQFPHEPDRLWSTEYREHTGFRIPEVHVASEQSVLVSSSTFQGHLPRRIGEEFQTSVDKVKAARLTAKAFKHSPYVKNNDSPHDLKNDCTTYVAADAGDSFYETAVEWGTTTAAAMGFGSLREVRIGPDFEGGISRRLDPVVFRAALYDCPAITFGGGNPAMFARNLKHMKVYHASLWGEMKTLIDKGLLFVFAYSAGAFVVGETGKHWLAAPDDPGWVARARNKSELEMWLKFGTLDLMGKNVVKSHFTNSPELLYNHRKMFRYVETEMNPATENMYALSDGQDSGRSGMDFLVLKGNWGYLRTSNVYSTGQDGRFGQRFGRAYGFYNYHTVVARASPPLVHRQQGGMLPRRHARIDLDVEELHLGETRWTPSKPTKESTDNARRDGGDRDDGESEAGSRFVGVYNAPGWPWWLILLMVVVPLVVIGGLIAACVACCCPCCHQKRQEEDAQMNNEHYGQATPLVYQHQAAPYDTQPAYRPPQPYQQYTGTTLIAAGAGGGGNEVANSDDEEEAEGVLF